MILHVFRAKKPPRITLPNSSCHRKVPELPTWFPGHLLGATYTWTSQRWPAGRPGTSSAGCGGGGSPWTCGEALPRRKPCRRLHPAAAPSLERHTFSTGTAYKTEVILIPEEQSWETLRKRKSSPVNMSKVKLYCITLKHHTLHPGYASLPSYLNSYQNKQEKHPITSYMLWFC